MIKLILIDFDDTLCMTEAERFHIENEIAIKMGHAPMTRATHQKHWGEKTLSESIKDRIPGINADAFMLQLEHTLAESIQNGNVDSIPEKNYKTLGILKKHGYKIAILTSRSQMEVAHLMKKTHPLAQYIDGFYNKDNTGFVKPNPRVFEKALEDFKVKPSEVVYIGDGVGDAQCSNDAKIHFIAIMESGLRKRDSFNNVTVDAFVDTFTDIPEAIKKL